jgi:hypothetical protein
MSYGGVVVFAYTEWIQQYPEFGYITQPQAQSFFNRITIGPVDNTPASPIRDLFERTVLLNMAVAHMTFLFGPGANGKPREVVGRISAASQGSVNVTLEYSVPKGPLESWWSQSPYGAEFYASTLKYRTARYFPPPMRTAFGSFNRRRF